MNKDLTIWTYDETKEFNWGLKFLGDPNKTITLILDVVSKVSDTINYDDPWVRKGKDKSSAFGTLFGQSRMARLARDLSCVTLLAATDAKFKIKILPKIPELQFFDLPSPNAWSEGKSRLSISSMKSKYSKV